MPLSKEYLVREKTSMRGVRFVLQNDVDHMRAAMIASELAAEVELPENSEDVDVQDARSGDLSLEVFTPITDDEPGTRLPILVYYHGGGLVLKGREWPLIERLCEIGQFIVVCPSYRLAPENPWPAGLDDAVTAYKWAHDNAECLNGNSDAMFISGTSAGGLLSFSAARSVLLDPLLAGTLKGILALVPATTHPNGVPLKYVEAYENYARHPDRWEDTVCIDRDSLRIMWTAARFPSLTDPSIWPLQSATRQDVRYPPVVLILAGCDPLYGDGKIMAAALEDAGTPVKAMFYPDMFHSFWNFALSETSRLFETDLPQALAWLKS